MFTEETQCSLSQQTTMKPSKRNVQKELRLRFSTTSKFRTAYWNLESKMLVEPSLNCQHHNRRTLHLWCSHWGSKNTAACFFQTLEVEVNPCILNAFWTQHSPWSLSFCSHQTLLTLWLLHFSCMMTNHVAMVTCLRLHLLGHWAAAQSTIGDVIFFSNQI